MDWDTIEGYWLAITQLEARELLVALTVSDYPWMKKEDKRKLHRAWHKMAYPKTYSPEVTTGELADKLKAALNG